MIIIDASSLWWLLAIPAAIFGCTALADALDGFRAWRSLHRDRIDLLALPVLCAVIVAAISLLTP